MWCAQMTMSMSMSMSMTTATYLSHFMSCCRSIADVRQKFRFVVQSASLSTLKKDPVSVHVSLKAKGASSEVYWSHDAPLP